MLKKTLLFKRLDACWWDEHSTRRVSVLNFLTDFGVPKILFRVFSIMKGDNFVMGLVESSASIIKNRGKCVELNFEVVSDSESESERARLAFFGVAILIF